MDYVDGELLVDPVKMMKDTFKSAGMFLGFVVGSYIERHNVKYEIPEGSKNLPMLGFIGVVIVLSWKEFMGAAIFAGMLGANWGNFVARFLMMLFAVAIYPALIKKWK